MTDRETIKEVAKEVRRAETLEELERSVRDTEDKEAAFFKPIRKRDNPLRGLSYNQVIDRIKDPTIDVGPSPIKYVKHQTLEMCKVAIKRDVNAARYIINPTYRDMALIDYMTQVTKFTHLLLIDYEFRSYNVCRVFVLMGWIKKPSAFAPPELTSEISNFYWELQDRLSGVTEDEEDAIRAKEIENIKNQYKVAYLFTGLHSDIKRGSCIAKSALILASMLFIVFMLVIGYNAFIQ